MKTEQEKIDICTEFLKQRGFQITKKALAQKEFCDLPDSGYVRVWEIAGKVVPLSTASIWRLAKIGSFPRPIKMSNNVTAWRVSDVREWLKNRLGA